MWRWDQQEPFGHNPADENPAGLGAFDLPLRLPGQVNDKETNLHYNAARDYDPSGGRYVQSDPIGLRGGLNTYAYADSTPLSRSDRFALMGGGGNHARRSTYRYPGSGCGAEGDFYNYPNEWGGGSFEDACQTHDRCYESCAKTKGRCDSDYYQDLRRACRESGGNPVCYNAANAYYLAVFFRGDDAFRGARQKYCKCSPN